MSEREVVTLAKCVIYAKRSEISQRLAWLCQWHPGSWKNLVPFIFAAIETE